MKKLSRIIAGLSTAAVMAVSAVSFSGSAATTVRDANGDGYFDIADAVDTRMYLLGLYNPTNVKSYDFDGNGIISMADVQKIQCCKALLLDQSSFPPPSTEVTNAVSTTRNYWRHNYESSNLTSKTVYSLTVDAHDNTAVENGISNPYAVIGENNMLRDYDTSVVKITGSGGTGFIVDDHTVVTAAHCVFSKSRKEFIDVKIEIVDANNNTIATYSPHYAHIPSQFGNGTKSSKEFYDYAILYFDEDLSQYGMFSMGVALDDYIEKKGSVIVSGFPQQYPDDYEATKWGVRFRAKGNVLNEEVGSKNPDCLYYNADTSTGDSGGPVFVEEAFTTNSKTNRVNYEFKTIIAIHTSSGNNYNYGKKVTTDVLKFVYSNDEITE